jgi:DNA-binding SARP family transcriptional activator/WD40 repeat protein
VLFRLLGPLEVSDGPGLVRLGEGRQRALLVLLLLHRNEPVSSDRLIDELWGETPPPTAAKVLQNNVRTLRRAVGDPEGRRLRTHGHAYALSVGDGELDVDRFEQLVRDGGDALADGRPSDAADRLREALALWRGPALADVGYETFAQPEIARLEQARTDALERRIDADLALGRHGDVVAELDALVVQHPLREHLRAQRMLALYRSGRQAEALEAFRDARRMLIEEVGVEPGADLRALHEAILRQDVALDLPPAALPRELDAAELPAIVGRDRELAWLRARWEDARQGAGEVVAVTGDAGAGKTRLAAELATQVHREGAVVLHVGATATADAVAAALASARDATRPTLVVVDDVDAPSGMPEALRGLDRAIGTAPVLAVVTGERLTTVVARERVALGPLDGDAVRRIALLYAPDDVDGPVPVDGLLKASGGVAARVHDAAAAWARRRARCRVVASAPRAAAGRSALRIAEAELAGGVVELQTARERADRLGAPDVPVVCPFKGLASFDAPDAAYFFGRERLVAELVARAVGAPLLGVVGPSGSGKSSVVRAGLLPALADGVLPGSEEWRQVVLRPGEHPLRELRDSRAEASTGDRLVLLVDQFEEVFTACRDEGERAAFADALVRLANGRSGDGLVVLALRADFYGRCATYPALSRLLGSNHVLVGPMQREELRRAIELPAQRAGLEVEPRLVDALLADVEREPGGLPLLSTALLELWQRRDGRTLRLAMYEAIGGVRGAVARLAEDAFARLEAPQQVIARTVLLRLSGEESGGAVVRRRVALSEFESDRDDDVARVLEVLAERRLLTMSASAVEVAHEALLREWPRLRRWLDEDAQGRRTHRRLTDAARDWDERGRDPADLYRGARLAVALEWRSSHEPELNSTERAFLDASRVATGRAQQRLRVALAGVAALLAIAVLGGVVALHQRSAARTQARVAEAQRISVQALAEPNLDRALLLARQGVALADSIPNRGNLLAVLLRNPAALGVVRGAGNPLRAIDLAPDGRTLVVGDSHGTVEYLDAVDHRRIGAPYRAGESIRGVRFSPDGTRVAVSGYAVGGTATAFVDLLDVRRHRSVQRLLASLPGYIESVGGVAFSPDSHVMTAEFVPWPQPGEYRHFVGRWDARSGRSLGPSQPVAPGEKSGPALGGFVAGGRLLVTSSAADGSTVIRDSDGALRPLRRFPGGGVPADVSPDGRRVVLLGRDHTARVLDLRTGLSHRLGTREDARIIAVHFTRDSHGLVTAAGDGRLTVWDARRATPVRSVGPLAGTVRDFAMSADGRTAYTAARDGSVIAWDLTGRQGMSRPFRGGSGVLTDLAAVPGSGATLAVASRSGDVHLLDGRTLARTGLIAAAPAVGGRRNAGATTVAIAPNGRTIAIGDADGAVRFADVRTGRPLGPPEPAHVGAVVAMAFSRDGRRLVTGGRDHAIYVWDVRRRTTAGPPYVGLVERPMSLSVSRDGTTVVATIVHRDGNGEIDILRLPRLELVVQKRAAPGRQTQFSRDGRRLFYGDAAGQVWTLDTRTWRPLGRPLRGGPGPGLFALSPGDDVLAASSDDGTTQLWDVASGRPIGTPLPGVPGGPARAAFVAGGAGLVTIGRDGRGSLWDLRPESWARRACAVAGRTLSRSEWRDALPERDYAPACRR